MIVCGRGLRAGGPEVVAQAPAQTSQRFDAELGPHYFPGQPRVVPLELALAGERPFAIEDQPGNRFLQVSRIVDAPLNLGARGFHWSEACHAPPHSGAAPAVENEFTAGEMRHDSSQSRYSVGGVQIWRDSLGDDQSWLIARNAVKQSRIGDRGRNGVETFALRVEPPPEFDDVRKVDVVPI